MQEFMRSIRQMTARDDGATMVEYGLMVALVAIVCLVAVAALGVNVQGVFEEIAAGI